jgi:hypothetical protein
MAKAVKSTKKVLTTKAFFTISGTDPRNGIVTLKKFGKGFLLTNTRTGMEETIAAQTKAIEAYNIQINNSH